MANSKKRPNLGRKQCAGIRQDRSNPFAPAPPGLGRNVAASNALRAPTAPSCYSLVFRPHNVLPAVAMVLVGIVASFYIQCSSSFLPWKRYTLLATTACLGAWLLLIIIQATGIKSSSCLSSSHPNASEASQSVEWEWCYFDGQEDREHKSHGTTDRFGETLFPLSAEGEKSDVMRGSGRRPTQIGISWHENNHWGRHVNGRSSHGGRGSRDGLHSGGRESIDGNDLDGCDGGSSVLGRRGSGRGCHRGWGLAGHASTPNTGHMARPQEAKNALMADGGGCRYRGRRWGGGALRPSSARAGATIGRRSHRSREAVAAAQPMVMFDKVHDIMSTTAKATLTAAVKTATKTTTETSKLAAIPLRPRSVAVPELAGHVASATLSAPASAATSHGADHEKTRRARRAERAVLTFREQRQQQQAEDAARRDRAQPGGRFSAASLPFSSDKDTAQPSKNMSPSSYPEPVTAITVAGSGRMMSIGTDQTVVANMKRKSGIALAGSDAEEGLESDDSNASFIMTRTAGKRRGNLSSGDMLANEILHDINEDLNTMAEEAEECDPVKRLHRGYMNEAIAMAQLALRTNETPVGCVLVHNDRVIAKGMNATNMTRNGTRHAELMCLNALMAQWDDVSDADSGRSDDSDCDSAQDYDNDTGEFTEQDWAQVDPSKGHLFPYGQKLHPARVVSPDIVRGCSLYVTVEPCIMCASMLRQYGIKKVYFGAANDKFGGTGGVLRIHMNSKPNEPAAQNATYIETYVTNMMSKPRRTRTVRQVAEATDDSTFVSTDKMSPIDSSLDPDSPPSNNPPIVRRASTIPIAEGSVPARDSGHGGNVEPGFDVEGGWGRDKAVFLLRQFYVQENGRAPAPRKKEGRAQRLVEQMKNEGGSSVKLPSSVSGHQAEVEVELDSLPLEASSPSRPVSEPAAASAADIAMGNSST